MPIMRWDSEIFATKLWAVPHPEEGNGDKVFLCSDNKRRDSSGGWIKPVNCQFRPEENNRKRFQIVRGDDWLAADDGIYIRFYVRITRAHPKKRRQRQES